MAWTTSPPSGRVGYVLAPQEADEASFFLGAAHLDHPGKSLEITRIEPLMSPNVEYLGTFSIRPRDYRWTAVPDSDHGFPAAVMTDRHPALNTVIPATETGVSPPGWGQDSPPSVFLAIGSGLCRATWAPSTAYG